MEWRKLIHTRRYLGVQMGWQVLFLGQDKCYDFNSSDRVKDKLVLVNIRELSRVPSTNESTLYICSAWSVHTSHLAYPKCYELYI